LWGGVGVVVGVWEGGGVFGGGLVGGGVVLALSVSPPPVWVGVFWWFVGLDGGCLGPTPPLPNPRNS